MIMCEVSCCRVGPAAALGVEVATLLALASDYNEHNPNYNNSNNSYPASGGGPSYSATNSAGASGIINGGGSGGGVGDVNPFDTAIVVRCVSQRVSK